MADFRFPWRNDGGTAGILLAQLGFFGSGCRFVYTLRVDVAGVVDQRFKFGTGGP